MKNQVLTTYRILKDKACNHDIDESWSDWAIEMIEAGYEADSLYQLAGITTPFNQFELQELTSKVLKDLNLDYSNKTVALRNYSYFLINSNIGDPPKYLEVLRKFRDLYYELNMDTEFQDFAYLYWAKEDLIYDDHQNYWAGADRTNIDKIIKEQFELWIKNFEDQKT